MLKFLTSCVVSLLFVACGSSNPETHTKMFQSVAKEDAVLVQKGEDKLYCSRCGMNLVKYYKTSHLATHKGKKFQYCSIHCLEDHLGEGISLKNPKVVDLGSLKFISVAQAYYVVGSSKRGTMSKVSKYAFKDKKEAQKFQNLYGGKIMDFKSAREITQEDFRHYRH